MPILSMLKKKIMSTKFQKTPGIQEAGSRKWRIKLKWETCKKRV